jgi:WD40 repeat protein
MLCRELEVTGISAAMPGEENKFTIRILDNVKAILGNQLDNLLFIEESSRLVDKQAISVKRVSEQEFMVSYTLPEKVEQLTLSFSISVGRVQLADSPFTVNVQQIVEPSQRPFIPLKKTVTVGSGVLKQPQSICVHNDEIFVADFILSCVFVFSVTGVFLRCFGNPISENPNIPNFENPTAIYAKGRNVYVACEGQRIFVFDLYGTFQKVWSWKHDVETPLEDFLYVSSVKVSDAGHVCICERATGKVYLYYEEFDCLILALTILGPNAKKFDEPCDMALSPTHFYVGESNSTNLFQCPLQGEGSVQFFASGNPIRSCSAISLHDNLLLIADSKEHDLKLMDISKQSLVLNWNSRYGEPPGDNKEDLDEICSVSMNEHVVIQADLRKKHLIAFTNKVNPYSKIFGGTRLRGFGRMFTAAKVESFMFLEVVQGMLDDDVSVRISDAEESKDSPAKFESTDIKRIERGFLIRYKVHPLEDPSNIMINVHIGAELSVGCPLIVPIIHSSLMPRTVEPNCIISKITCRSPFVELSSSRLTICDEQGKVSSFSSETGAELQEETPKCSPSSKLASGEECFFILDWGEAMLHKFSYAKSNPDVSCSTFCAPGEPCFTSILPNGTAAILSIADKSLKVFSMLTGDLFKWGGGEGFRNGQFQDIVGVCSNENKFFVCQSSDRTVQVLDNQGNFIRRISLVQAPEMGVPMSVAAYMNHVYVGDSKGFVHCFDELGDYMESWNAKMDDSLQHISVLKIQRDRVLIGDYMSGVIFLCKNSRSV